MPLNPGPLWERLKTEEIKITEMGNQIVHLSTNIILLGLQEALDGTLNLNYRGPVYRVLIYEYGGSRCLL